INKRDYQDSHREIAPLKQAEDAILVDNSNCNLEQGAELIINEIRKRIKV
ncbi:MAG: (d)CMP kinase, partial [Ruminococcus sp.]|nr:(d)CMP kinase [Candidatus Copronaster equi]